MARSTGAVWRNDRHYRYVSDGGMIPYKERTINGLVAVKGMWKLWMKEGHQGGRLSRTRGG